MATDDFKYVVARPWCPNKEASDLCIYTYYTQVQTGTVQEAEEFLSYVKRQELDPCKAQHYSIYKVTYEKI